MRSQPPPEAAFADHNVAAHWDQAHRYGPAPRHRRRLIRKLVRDLEFDDVLDAGCAQPHLLSELVREFGVKGYGCDISDKAMEAARVTMPSCEFRAIDLAYERWPDDRQFDLVVCSETLEHIAEWRLAVDNLVAMTRRGLLITVPSGVIRPVDKLVGHHQHFAGPELVRELEQRGLSVRLMRFWGFPMHSLYRVAVDKVGSDALYESFAEGKPFSRSQKLLSDVLYTAFFLNQPFRSGSQLIVLAEKA
jgi:SAM-dependent methyltransferase